MEADNIFRRRVVASRSYLGRYLDFEVGGNTVKIDPTVSLRSLVNKQHTTVMLRFGLSHSAFSILFPTQMSKDDKDR